MGKAAAGLIPIVLAGLLGPSAGVAAHERPGSPGAFEVSATPSLAVIKPAPDFALRDTTDRPVRLGDLRGRVVLVSFIYTTCSDSCPLLTRRMALLRERLAAAGLAGATHFLSVTVDPERDSAERLREYARQMGAVRDGWQFLREEPTRLRPVLALYDEWTRPGAREAIDHPARLYLIDPAGRIREIYSLAFFDERQAFVDIRALVAERR
jgi:protein SCO1/2